MAALMAVMMVTDVVLPSMVYALSSGPSQPEVQGFQPAGTNDMVDLFTGDLSYNISLLDVEGYPLNLFYFFIRNLGEMRKIKSKQFVIYQRTSLLHMVTQYSA